MNGPSPRDVAQARATLRADRKARKADRPMKFDSRPFPAKPPARIEDKGFARWMHEHGLPCIACLIEGPAPATGEPNPIECAHQKQAIAAKGWHARKGVRPGDDQQVPLCRWHHQLAPNACDKAQRKFWDRLGVGDLVVDLCRDLYAAFKGGQDGAAIINRYARSTP